MPRGLGTRRRASHGAAELPCPPARSVANSGSIRASRTEVRRAHRDAGPVPCRGAPAACRRSHRPPPRWREGSRPREHAEASEQLPFLVREEVVAPRDRVPSVRWRGSASRSPDEMSSRDESRSSSCSTENRRSRAAASCNASGSRSRRSTRVASAGEVPAMTRWPARAPGRTSPRRRASSPGRRSVRRRAGDVRLVTSSTRLGAELRSASRSPSSGSRCSALSRRISVRRPWSLLDRGAETGPRVLLDREYLRDRRLGGERITQGSEGNPPEPSRERRGDLVRGLIASRVFPIPPGPAIVSRRVAGSARRSVTSASLDPVR